MIATKSLSSFYAHYNRWAYEGRHPRWFQLNGTYFICTDSIIDKAKKEFL